MAKQIRIVLDYYGKNIERVGSFISVMLIAAMLLTSSTGVHLADNQMAHFPYYVSITHQISFRCASVEELEKIFLPIVIGGSDMARYTRPVPGRSNTYPNAGPYSADQWAELLNILHVGDDGSTSNFRYSRGPFASYLNRLEVTNPAAANFTIDTGAALVNGHLCINDDDVTITADTPAANPRIDRVVVVYNNTNAAINATTVGGFTFNVAGGGTEIPAYTAEIAIMKGAEAAMPALPALEQDDTRLWMIELARYQISVVPAITNFTDYRDYVDAETKYKFYPFNIGRNTTDALDAFREVGPGQSRGVPMADLKHVYVGTAFIVESDFIEDMTASVIVVPAATGNAVLATTILYGQYDGEPYNQHTDAFAEAPVAVTVAENNNECAVLLTDPPTVGDIIELVLFRNGDDGDDTVGATVYANGVLVTYFGWRR